MLIHHGCRVGCLARHQRTVHHSLHGHSTEEPTIAETRVSRPRHARRHINQPIAEPTKSLTRQRRHFHTSIPTFITFSNYCTGTASFNLTGAIRVICQRVGGSHFGNERKAGEPRNHVFWTFICCGTGTNPPLTLGVSSVWV